MLARLFAQTRPSSSGFRRLSTVSPASQVRQLQTQLAECHARRERFWNRLFFAQVVCLPIAFLAQPPQWFEEMVAIPPV